jgi:hypothetical protein
MKKKRDKRARKVPQPKIVAPDRTASTNVKPLEPLIVRVHFPFIPPGTPADEAEKTLAPYRKAWRELQRRQLRLVDTVMRRIRRSDDTNSNDKKQLAQDALELAIALGIDVDKIQADPPDVAVIERQLLRKRKWKYAEAYLSHALKVLVHAAVEEKDDEAAVALASMVQKGVALLAFTCAGVPDLFKAYASQIGKWPTLVDRKGRADAWVPKLLARINLAADTIEPRIRDAQGGSEAREWARAILDALEHTRRNINGPPYVRDMSRLLQQEAAVTLQPVPAWVRRCAKLPPFGPNMATLDAWKATGAEMLKTECPDFHKHKDWDRFAARWKNMSEREKAGRILDGIKDAMETLAGARASKRHPQQNFPA